MSYAILSPSPRRCALGGPRYAVHIVTRDGVRVDSFLRKTNAVRAVKAMKARDAETTIEKKTKQ